MKRKKSIFHKLSVQIVIGILFFITVLTILIILIGYSVFMKSIYAENVNSARITADYAGSNSHPWDFQAYVDIGLDRMWNMEWLYDGEELKEGMEREQGLISDFFVMMYALDGVVSADEENTVALPIRRSWGIMWMRFRSSSVIPFSRYTVSQWMIPRTRSSI